MRIIENYIMLSAIAVNIVVFLLAMLLYRNIKKSISHIIEIANFSFFFCLFVALVVLINALSAISSKQEFGQDIHFCILIVFYSTIVNIAVRLYYSRKKEIITDGL